MYGIPVYEDKIKLIGDTWFIHLGKNTKTPEVSEYRGILIAGSDNCPHCVNLSNILKKIDSSPEMKGMKWLPYSFDIHMTSKAHSKSQEMKIEYMPQLYIIMKDNSLKKVVFEDSDKPDEKSVADKIKQVFLESEK